MSPDRPSKIYVAVVDNDESFCRSFERLLRAAGFQAVNYDSAEAFLADDRRPRFGCLVLDVQLGGMTGLELARQLTALGFTTPVIYLTAQDDAETQRQAQDQGCEGYFSKTEPAQAILNAIHQAVAASMPPF